MERLQPLGLEKHAPCLPLAPRARVPTELHERPQLLPRLRPTHRRAAAAAAAAAAAWGSEAHHAAEAAVDQAHLARSIAEQP